MNWHDAVKSSEGFWKKPERSWKFWDMCCMGDSGSNKAVESVSNKPSTYESERKITHYWSKEDDRRLIKLVARYNYDWNAIAGKFRDKTAAQLERRWKNKLDPSMKNTAWTDEEDIVLNRLVLQFGYEWDNISKYMQGRPPGAIKNRFINNILPFLSQQELVLLQERLTHKAYTNGNGMDIDRGSFTEQNREECLEFLHKKIDDLQNIMEETKDQIEKLEKELCDSHSLLS